MWGGWAHCILFAAELKEFREGEREGGGEKGKGKKKKAGKGGEKAREEKKGQRTAKGVRTVKKKEEDMVKWEEGKGMKGEGRKRKMDERKGNDTPTVKEERESKRRKGV